MDKPKAEMPKTQPLRLVEALREARLETAERTGVVVDLKDAQIARLELLNEAVEPLFAEIPETVDLFDRGISRGDTPRLWIDMLAHVQMDRERRVYRFIQDTRHGTRVIAETAALDEMVREIRANEGSRTELAKRMGVCIRTINNVRRRVAWKHVE